MSVSNLLPYDGIVRYFPRYFHTDEADSLFDGLMRELNWTQEHALLFGRSIPLPRLTAWFGPTAYSYSGICHPPCPLPPILERIQRAIEPTVGSEDSVLANLYRDGRDSMAYHADDEKLWGDNPTIASISFGANRRFLLKSRRTGERVSVDLEHGSLLVMAGSTQHNWNHAVPKTQVPVDRRINLTYRRLA